MTVVGVGVAGRDGPRPAVWPFPCNCRWDRQGRAARQRNRGAARARSSPAAAQRGRGHPSEPRCTGVRSTWLTEDLDAAVAGLHRGDDVRFRRAGRQAVAIVLQHCADTGRSWWGWTPWEWARLCSGSAHEGSRHRPVPTRPGAGPPVRGGAGLSARRIEQLRHRAGHVQSTSPRLLDLLVSSRWIGDVLRRGGARSVRSASARTSRMRGVSAAAAARTAVRLDGVLDAAASPRWC